MSPLPDGAAKISLDNCLRQRSAPVPASKAITSPSVLPTKARSPPTPTPPPTGTSSLTFHKVSPVVASTATTLPSLSAT